MIPKDSKRFLIILAMMAALPPFATDTYLPGIPVMAQFFHVSPNTMLITISTYLIGFGLGIFIWGPLSDLYGRKHIITIGMSLYVVSTYLSTLATHFDMLATTRLLQAFGDSAGVTISFSMARDCFSGIKLIKTQTTLAIMIMIAPMISPVIGTVLLMHNHWHNIFYFLSLYGVVLLLVTRFIPETLDKSLGASHFLKSFKNYISHVKNKRFLLLAFCTACSFSAFFCFIGSASIIYLEIYHTGKFLFCLLFAINTLAIILANVILKKICDKYSPIWIELRSACLGLCGAAVTIVLTHLWPNAWQVFMVGIFVTTLGFCLLTSCLMSDAANHVSYAFGASTSIINIFRNSMAALSTLSMSHWISTSPLPLSIEQFIMAIIILLLLILLRKIPASSS